MSGQSTTHIGNYFEWTGSTSSMVKYYYADGQRIATRTGTGTNTSGLTWLVGDHLGSTSVSYDATSGSTVTQLYKPWGEPRPIATMTVKYTYTGQYSYAGSGNDDFGLMYYNARWYEPSLGRWAQPDTIIPDPGSTQDWDRYAYVRNNPIKYTDPSGHMICGPDGHCANSAKALNEYQHRAGLVDGFAGIVDLAGWTTRWQNHSEIFNKYEYMACGLVAGSYALNSGSIINDVDKIALAAGDSYNNKKGIQPTQLVQAYIKVFGESNVSVKESNNAYSVLVWMYDQINLGNIVIVDMLITYLDHRPPSKEEIEQGTLTFAHFARVIQIDFENQTITIDNTLNEGNSYWTIPLQQFIDCWYDPERRATNKPTVTQRIAYWAVSIHPNQ